MERDKSILINHLSIGYIQGKKHEEILSEISFSIPKGNLVSIIGANGTGKSTLLRTLAHQQPKLSGSININNIPLESYSVNQWAKQVSWVHTETMIPSSLSVHELVSLGRQPYTNWLDTLTDVDQNEIEKALQLTDLDHLKDKKCNTLSDGQLQRVFIARAIAQNTPLIFLDEPTTHLDLHHKVETLTLLKSLCKELNKTIVYSSHEIELSLQVCDQVLSISNKKVALQSPKELVESNLLNELFKDSKVHFDKQLGKFVFK